MGQPPLLRTSHLLETIWESHGWLHVTTTHRTAQGVQTIGQQLSAADEGQRVPSFPLTIIGRILAGELPRPTNGVTRFIDVLSPQEFLEELALKGISYQTSA